MRKRNAALTARDDQVLAFLAESVLPVRTMDVARFLWPDGKPFTRTGKCRDCGHTHACVTRPYGPFASDAFPILRSLERRGLVERIKPEPSNGPHYWLPATVEVHA